MATERTADVTWNGSLLEGGGTIDRVGSGAFGPLEVTWAARAEPESSGRTSPEELIAAAHAACFSMALSHGLAEAGTPASELKTSATVSFVPGTGITKIVLRVSGDVPGTGRCRIPRSSRRREGELPGVEGARCGSGDRARDGGVDPKLTRQPERSGRRVARRRFFDHGGSMVRFVARAAAVVVLALFMEAAPAAASTPSITISASTTVGAAPLVVTLEAHGDAVSYRWQLGNGETAEGPTTTATYGPGSWTAQVTGTAADGATAQATILVRSVAIAVLPMPKSHYSRSALIRGSVVPALAGEQVVLYARGRKVAATRAATDGTFRLRLLRVRTPGPYELRTPVASSAPFALRVDARA